MKAEEVITSILERIKEIKEELCENVINERGKIELIQSNFGYVGHKVVLGLNPKYTYEHTILEDWGHRLKASSFYLRTNKGQIEIVFRIYTKVSECEVDEGL